MRQAPGSCRAGLIAENKGRSLTGAAAESLAHHLLPTLQGHRAVPQPGISQLLSLQRVKAGGRHSRGDCAGIGPSPSPGTAQSAPGRGRRPAQQTAQPRQSRETWALLYWRERRTPVFGGSKTQNFPFLPYTPRPCQGFNWASRFLPLLLCSISACRIRSGVAPAAHATVLCESLGRSAVEVHLVPRQWITDQVIPSPLPFH